eukprot:1143634-Pelagomonas_calceolata.AAC.7
MQPGQGPLKPNALCSAVGYALSHISPTDVPFQARVKTTMCRACLSQPPEVLVNDDYGPKIDVWAIGESGLRLDDGRLGGGARVIVALSLMAALFQICAASSSMSSGELVHERCLMCEMASGRPMFPGKTSADQLWLTMLTLGPLPPRLSNLMAEDPSYDCIKWTGTGSRMAVHKLSQARALLSLITALPSGREAVNPEFKLCRACLQGLRAAILLPAQCPLCCTISTARFRECSRRQVDLQEVTGSSHNTGYLLVPACCRYQASRNRPLWSSASLTSLMSSWKWSKVSEGKKGEGREGKARKA